MTGGVGSRSCSCCTPASAGRTCRPSWGWLRDDLLAAVAPVDRGRDLRPAPPDPAGRAQRRRGDRLVSGGRRRSPPAGQQGGAGVGPSPVARACPGSKHHLICDGGGIPLKVITTGGNINDVSSALDLVDGIPPVAGRLGRPRRRPDALLADKGYDSDRLRRELARRRIVPIISYRGTKGVQGLGKLRYVVEQTLALLYQFRRLAVRRERHLHLHDALVFLACALICRRRLNRRPRSC